MPDYRAYIIGQDGHFQKSVPLECPDDDAAKQQAEQPVAGHDVELWQRDRHELVRRLEQASDQWIEILTCSRCGETGIAELWDSPAFEGFADLVPPGFKVVHHMQGRAFYCVDCDLPARSEPR